MHVSGHAGPGGRGAAAPTAGPPSGKALCMGGLGARRAFPHKRQGVIRSELLQCMVCGEHPQPAPARPDTCGPPWAGSGSSAAWGSGPRGMKSLCSGLGASGWRGVLPTAQSRRETGRKHTGLPTCPIQAPGLSPAIRAGPCSWQDDSGSGAQPRPGGGLHPAPRGRLRGRAERPAATGRGEEACRVSLLQPALLATSRWLLTGMALPVSTNRHLQSG